MEKDHSLRTWIGLGCLLGCLAQNAQAQPILWLNHLDFLPGDATVNISHPYVQCPGAGGLSGLAITSTTLGELGPASEIKVVYKGIEVPPTYRINAVRICYKNSSESSFISQVRLCQLKNPPDSCLVRMDDPTNHTNVGPVCVNVPAGVDPSPDSDALEGALRLSLTVNFGDLNDTICLLGVGLVGTAREKGPAACQDAVDNDGDGATDCDDPGCAGKRFCP